MKIGDKVKVKEDLTDNSVAYDRRGQIGIITKYESDRTFPYFVDFGQGENRIDWFWKKHLEVIS